MRFVLSLLSILLIPSLASEAAAFVVRSDVLADGVGVPITSVQAAVSEPGQYSLSFVGTAQIDADVPISLPPLCLESLSMSIDLSDSQEPIEEFPWRGTVFAAATVEVSMYVYGLHQTIPILTATSDRVMVRVNTEWGGGEFYGDFEIQSQVVVQADGFPNETISPVNQQIRFDGYFTEYNTANGPVMDWHGRLRGAVAVPNEGDSWGALKARINR